MEQSNNNIVPNDEQVEVPEEAVEVNDEVEEEGNPLPILYLPHNTYRLRFEYFDNTGNIILTSHYSINDTDNIEICNTTFNIAETLKILYLTDDYNVIDTKSICTCCLGLIENENEGDVNEEQQQIELRDS